MMKLAAAMVLTALAAGGYLFWLRPDAGPALEVARVSRRTIETWLVTNGRIEPGRRFDVFAETAGRVRATAVQEGDRVERGSLLVEIESGVAEAALEQARARASAAEAEAALVERGLSAAERAEIEARLRDVEEQAREVREEAARVARLVERQAAPRVEQAEIERRLAALERDAETLRAKLDAQPEPAAIEAAHARLKEALAGVERERRALAATRIRSPAAGRVYSLAARVGDFLTPGALTARIDAGGGVRARIHVDEPELGRVSMDDMVRLTSDTYPDREWTCRTDRLPTEIVSLETRRVGEVGCAVEGDSSKLIPNLTINARIRTGRAENVIAAPRQAVRRGDEGEWVWVIDESGSPDRRAVETGLRDAEFVEIRVGLAEGEAVALGGFENLGPRVSIRPMEAPR